MKLEMKINMMTKMKTNMIKMKNTMNFIIDMNKKFTPVGDDRTDQVQSGSISGRYRCAFFIGIRYSANNYNSPTI